MKSAIVFSTLIAAAFCVTSSANTIHVPGDYPTIQQGIDECSPYDTIFVGFGTFTEFLLIDKPVAIIGAHIDHTYIEPPGDGNIVTVTANHVSIENLQVRGGDAYDDAAILLDMVDSCLICDCYIWYNYDGVVFRGGTGNVIRCNFINENLGNGIRLSENPDSLLGAHANIIETNVFNLNHITAINFDHIMMHHYQNIVRGNRIIGNTIGLLMITSQENVIEYNDIQANTHYGVSISMCMGGGENNSFHHNNFHNNGDSGQAYDMFGNNHWCVMGSGEGNYWSDYQGPDNDSNGIGDNPMPISGGGAMDYYPLMNRLYASVEGVVTDSYSYPIPGADVLINYTDLGVHTNSQGYYRYDSVWAGYTSMTFYHEGYLETTFTFIPFTPSQTTVINAVMQLTGDIRGNEQVTPGSFYLEQNYPNPFNGRTIITFELRKSSPVELAIYDICGKVVSEWEYQALAAGWHDIIWDADRRASGVYFARLSAGEDSQTRRMVLLK